MVWTSQSRRSRRIWEPTPPQRCSTPLPCTDVVTAQTPSCTTAPTTTFCYPDERTSSASANAHVLETLASDKWHASSYYATVCCAKALVVYGGPHAHSALSRAAAWTRDTRHASGRWGHDTGTLEETAYAV
jgi:hypothetical protein